MKTDTFGNFIEHRHDEERSATLLKRLYLVERELMRALAAKHIAIEHWTAKNIMPRHWWVASPEIDVTMTFRTYGVLYTLRHGTKPPIEEHTE